MCSYDSMAIEAIQGKYLTSMVKLVILHYMYFNVKYVNYYKLRYSTMRHTYHIIILTKS